MKKCFLLLAATASLVACEQGGESKVALTNNIDSVSYSIGMSIAQNLEKGGLKDLDVNLLSSGLKDLMDSTSDLHIQESEINGILQAYYMKKQEVKVEEEKQEFEVNIEEGAKFLEENKAKEGIVVTESGLQYEVITAAEGDKPLATDKVTVHYHGTLLDGTVFDSSVDRGEPASFPVNGVIMGWQELLQLMPAGSKYKVYIPYDLAYGERGAGSIPPYSTLIFEVELLEIAQ